MKLKDRFLRGKLVRSRFAIGVEKLIERITFKFAGNKMRGILCLIVNAKISQNVFNDFRTYFDDRRDEALTSLSSQNKTDVISSIWEDFVRERGLDIPQFFSPNNLES